MKTKKKTEISFVDLKILNNSQNTTIFAQQAQRSATLLKRDSNTFSYETSLEAVSDIW